MPAPQFVVESFYGVITEYIEMVLATVREKKIPRMARLRRPMQFNITLTDDEREYIKREAYERGLSANSFIRAKLLKNGWREELYGHRMNQPSDWDKRK